MKGDMRNRGFRNMMARIFPFISLANTGKGLYPESLSHVSIGGSDCRPHKSDQKKGRFGSAKPASLRKYARKISKAKNAGFDHIKGKARFGSRPMGRIRPVVTSKMARAAKRRKYEPVVINKTTGGGASTIVR